MTASAGGKKISDWPSYKRAREELLDVCVKLFAFPAQREHEAHFALAAVRRTLSLETAFRQALDSQNGQMAMTLVRLNLDTLARFYALYWAECTPGMSAEMLAENVARGKNIKNMRFCGAREKATDRWLINKIEGLGSWIPKVYSVTSGAIHFSDFHITQMLGQAGKRERLEDGSLRVELSIGPGERDPDANFYTETNQAFLHITLMLICALQHRCELALK